MADAATPPHDAHRATPQAFRDGSYDGVAYSQEYGDLGATIAAVLLDPEARSVTLEADPSHGLMREPLLKLHHVIRSASALRRNRLCATAAFCKRDAKCARNPSDLQRPWDVPAQQPHISRAKGAWFSPN